MKEFIIYTGKYYTLEWYYDENGKSQALEYFEELDKDKKVKFLKLAKLIGEMGKIFDKTKFNNEGDKIYAFKPVPHCFLCFFFKGKQK